MDGRRHLAQLSDTGARATGVDASIDGRIDPEEAELALDDDAAFPVTPAPGSTLVVAAGVRMCASRIVECDCGDTSFPRGARVVCETASGLVTGDVVIAARRTLLCGPLPRIVRRASAGDETALASLRKREQGVFEVAKAAARANKLPVKVARAEAQEGGGKFLVYFASDSKVSFRDWLRAIGQSCRERVELRQIGMRDAARLIGGVGPCGLQLCCNTFLSDFTPVGIKMAKSQGLTPNPQKVSGMCGRLLCCLVYEEAHYRAGRAKMPGPGDTVDTADGRGRVREVDVLQMRVTVALDDGGTRTFPADEVTRRPVE